MHQRTLLHTLAQGQHALATAHARIAALNGRSGEQGVPIQVVQNNLGHASIGTTSGYLTTERDMRLAAMKGFGVKGRSPASVVS